MYSIFFLAVTAFALCFLLTPLVTAGSRRLGLLDHPRAGRKTHAVAVPRTGGVAIVAACVAAIGLLLLTSLKGAARVDLSVAQHLLPAGAAIFALGLLDDLVGLNAWKKLLGQALASYLAYLGGVHITGFAGYALPAWSTLPITMAWLIACSNAFNLIDGMDGLAAGIGLFATFTTLSAALVNDNIALALATAPLLGALLAFLRYNFNPASIFLGDCGSLTIGFLLGCFGAIWSQKSATLFGMAAPLMALTVPLADAGVAVVRRFLRRQPIFTPDRNHLHHRLLDRGFSTRKVVLIVYGLCGVATAFSLLQNIPNNPFSGLLLIVFCIAMWILIQLIGYVEFDTARHLLLTGALRHLVSARLFVTEFERKVSDAVTPDDYWASIREAAREFGCSHTRLSLQGAVFEERDPSVERKPSFTMRIPLSDDGYLNFKCPAEASLRLAVAIGSIGEILQRKLAARASKFETSLALEADVLDLPERPVAAAAGPWEAHSADVS